MSLREKNGKLEYRFMEQGRSYRGSTDLEDTRDGRKKAQIIEAEHRKRVMEGKEDQEHKIISIPFSDAAALYNDYTEGKYRDHPASHRRRKANMSVLAEKFGDKPLNSITQGDIENFISWRAKHDICDGTIRSDVQGLSTLFKYGIKQHWCKVNWVNKDLDVPSSKESNRINVRSEEQEEEYFKLLTNEVHTRVRREARHTLRALDDVSVLILKQGCRPSELLALTKDDVDLVDKSLYIRKGKSEAAKRKLRLTRESLAALAIRVQHNTTDWLFPNYRDSSKPISLITLDAMLVRMIDEWEIDEFVLYDLRHTFATRAVERKVDLYTLAKIMGHADTTMLKKYVHPNQSHMDDAMDLLDQKSFRVVSSGVGPNLGQIER